VVGDQCGQNSRVSFVPCGFARVCRCCCGFQDQGSQEIRDGDRKATVIAYQVNRHRALQRLSAAVYGHHWAAEHPGLHMTG